LPFDELAAVRTAADAVRAKRADVATLPTAGSSCHGAPGRGFEGSRIPSLRRTVQK
jgi:cytochrome c553